MTCFPLRSLLFVSVLSVACAEVTDEPIEGDMSGVGGTGSSTASGGDASGGASSGGATSGGTSSGGAATGGTSTGGAATGGASTGGASTGGAATGGATTGGASTGGAATGGATTGGASTGGAATGGASTGGTSTGGAATGGGTSTGGAGTGGTAAIAHSNDPVDCTGKPAYSGTWVWAQGNGQVTAICSTGTPCTQGSPAATSGKTYLFECTHSHKPNCQGQDPATMNWSDPPWTRVGECTEP
jgi:hypothetical protein